jgi:hypothetical protein
MLRAELRLGELKNSMTLEIEPVTFLLVAEPLKDILL